MATPKAKLSAKPETYKNFIGGRWVKPMGGATMENLIGSDVEAWLEFVTEPGAHLHLYNKGEARPGRKMGHVTRLTA